MRNDCHQWLFDSINSFSAGFRPLPKLSSWFMYPVNKGGGRAGRERKKEREEPALFHKFMGRPLVCSLFFSSVGTLDS